MKFTRKRIKTLYGLDGYCRLNNNRLDSILVQYDNKWYEAHESFTFFKITRSEQRKIFEVWGDLPTEYEVMDISSYEKPF